MGNESKDERVPVDIFDRFFDALNRVEALARDLTQAVGNVSLNKEKIKKLELDLDLMTKKHDVLYALLMVGNGNKSWKARLDALEESKEADTNLRKIEQERLKMWIASATMIIVALIGAYTKMP